MKPAVRIEDLRYRFDTCSADSLDVDRPMLEASVARLRSLNLAEGVRIQPELFPTLHAAVESVRTRLAPDLKIEAYVRSGPELQAWCTGGATPGSAMLAISSGLIQLLSPGELAFVLGHEVGHAVLGHVGHALDELAPPGAHRLTIRALSRAAEISADRLGRIAAPSTASAMSAILKIASGLGEPHLRLDVGAFLDQLDALSLAQDPSSSMRTHPVFALRCKALLWFEQSREFEMVSAGSSSSRKGLNEIDERIDHEISLTLGFRHAHANEATARELLLWGALGLFTLDHRIERSEQALLRHYFGAEATDKALSYVQEHGISSIGPRLQSAFGTASLLPKQDRESLLVDLETIAASAGGTDLDRTTFLGVLSRGLRIDRPVFVRNATVALKGGFSVFGRIR